MRIALATCSRLPDLYAEEQELLPLFAKRGIQARAVIWNDPTVDWASYDRVVIRSTWDYFHLVAEFRAWLARLRQLRVRTVNSLRLLEWNMDKLYLKTLEQGGARIIPTVFFEQGAKLDLAALIAARGWGRVIVKPAVSGGAFETYLFDGARAADYQGKVEAILRGSGLLVQPFFPEIEVEGECSLFFFGGEYAFAVMKVPAPKDFRVQFEHGGTFRRFVADDGLIAQALAVVARLPQKPAYARVDGVRRGSDFFLMEVELIEPYLHLAVAPEMAERYVDAISQAVLH
ncbi:MAG: hypothetical protein HY074_19310 [Deltaproteobacteria bacterium]|nr:hypothetical protein [Deltaproteobacteria bacterium]